MEVSRLDPGAVTDLGDVSAVALGAAICAAGFAFSSYAPRRTLLPIGVVAAIAMLISQSLGQGGFGSTTWPTAVAAFFVGLVSYTVAGRLRVPPLVVVVSAVVPMLPGLSIYRGLSLLTEDSTQASGRPAGADDGGLGRARAGLRRDPRGVRRPAAAPRGQPARGPALRTTPGRPAPDPAARGVAERGTSQDQTILVGASFRARLATMSW